MAEITEGRGLYWLLIFKWRASSELYICYELTAFCLDKDFPPLWKIFPSIIEYISEFKVCWAKRCDCYTSRKITFDSFNLWWISSGSKWKDKNVWAFFLSIVENSYRNIHSGEFLFIENPACFHTGNFTFCFFSLNIKDHLFCHWSNHIHTLFQDWIEFSSQVVLNLTWKLKLVVSWISSMGQE